MLLPETQERQSQNTANFAMASWPFRRSRRVRGEDRRVTLSQSALYWMPSLDNEAAPSLFEEAEHSLAKGSARRPPFTFF
jgi:hypothetical protein